MPRSLPLIVLFIAAVTLPANAASDEHGSVKRHPARHWHGYGFLPGYRTPEQIAREDEWLFWRRHPITTGMAGRASIAAAGMAVDSAHAGRRRRSGRCGIAASEPEMAPCRARS